MGPGVATGVATPLDLQSEERIKEASRLVQSGVKSDFVCITMWTL